MQKQGISGLLNIFTTIKHCAKLKLLYSESLPSQSLKPLSFRFRVTNNPRLTKHIAAPVVYCFHFRIINN